MIVPGYHIAAIAVLRIVGAFFTDNTADAAAVTETAGIARGCGILPIPLHDDIQPVVGVLGDLCILDRLNPAATPVIEILRARPVGIKGTATFFLYFFMSNEMQLIGGTLCT